MAVQRGYEIVHEYTEIQRDRCQGQSLRQIAKAYRVSTATWSQSIEANPKKLSSRASIASSEAF
jgi:hypothetical protein